MEFAAKLFREKVSGFKRHEPEFQRMLDQIRQWTRSMKPAETSIHFRAVGQHRHPCWQDDHDGFLQYAWAPQIFATLGGFSGGWLALRGAGSRRPLQSSRILVCFRAASALLPTAWITNLPTAGWATIGISLSFFLTVAISVNVYAMALDLFGEDRAAFAFSLLTCIYGLMQTVISPPIGGWIDHHGFALICKIGAFTPLLGVAVLRVAIPRK